MSNPTPPHKKVTTPLWWVLGSISVVVIICCIGVVGTFGYLGHILDDGPSGDSSSVNSPEATTSSASSSPRQHEKAAAATAVSEGGSATLDGIHLEAGWSVVENNVSGLSLRNDTDARETLIVTFYFMDDGDLIDDVTCATSILDAGGTDDSPSCYAAHKDIDGHDGIRVADGR